MKKYSIHIVATYCFDRDVVAESEEEAKAKVQAMAMDSTNEDWEFQEYVDTDCVDEADL